MLTFEQISLSFQLKIDSVIKNFASFSVSSNPAPQQVQEAGVGIDKRSLKIS